MIRKLSLTSLLGLAWAAPHAAAQPYDTGPSVTSNTASCTSTITQATSPTAQQGSGSGQPHRPALQPGIHPQHDAHNMNHLDPNHDGTMYYSEQGDDLDHGLEHMFAHLNTTFNYPAIILEHSAYFESVSCVEDGLKVEFNSPEALSYAQNTWKKLVDDHWLLVSFSKGCEVADNGQRTYWLVSDTHFDSNSLEVIVDCEQIDVSQAIDMVDMTYGKYKPPVAAGGTPPTPSSTKAPDTMITPAPEYKPVLKRGIFSDVTGGAKSVVSDATSDVDSAVHQGISFAETVAADAKSALASIGQDVESALSQGASKTFTRPIDAHPTDLTGSPWGQQKELFSLRDFNMYCVDCGLKGQVIIGGKIAFSITQMQLIHSQINVNGDLDLALGAGFTAEQNWIPIPIYDKPLFEQGLPGLSITDIISIGPSVSISAQIQAVLMASGTMLTTFEASWKNFSATIDMVHPKQSTGSGFKPELNHNVSASGNFSVKLNFGIPFSLNFGLDIPPLGKWGHLDVSISNTPELQFAGTYSNRPSDECYNGVELEFLFKDVISISAFNLPIGYPIWSWSAPDFWKDCIHLPPQKSTFNETDYNEKWFKLQSQANQQQPPGNLSVMTSILTASLAEKTGMATLSGHSRTSMPTAAATPA